MHYSKKQMLFDLFMDKWQHQFEKVPHILNHVMSYPEVLAKIEDSVPLGMESMSKSQLEWVSLVAQFEDPIETKFFKDHWIPIQKNGYDYFIDISSDKFQIFKAHYFFFEPYCWYKQYVIDDVVTFLNSMDSKDFNFEEYFHKLEKDSWIKVQSFFKERKELGFED